MKRTPLTRKTPLKKTRMKRKRRRGDKPNDRLAYLQEHDSCAICWKRWNQFGAENCVHHIVGGPGRKDVRANFVTLCAEHHDLYHVGFVLTPGMVLAAKFESDPEGYDESVICELLGRKQLPERWLPVPLPEWVPQERRRNMR